MMAAYLKTVVTSPDVGKFKFPSGVRGDVGNRRLLLIPRPGVEIDFHFCSGNRRPSPSFLLARSTRETQFPTGFALGLMRIGSMPSAPLVKAMNCLSFINVAKTASTRASIISLLRTAW